MNSIKRFLSLTLALLIALSLSPVQAIEAGQTEIDPKNVAASRLETLQTPQSLVVLSDEPAAEDTSIQSPSGIVCNTRVSYEIVTAGMTGETETDTRSAVIRFTLENPGDQPVSFEFTAVSASVNINRHLTGILSGTVNLSKEEPQMDITIGIKPFGNNPSNYGIPFSSDTFWKGERVFYLFCENIHNALFDGDGNSLTIPVPVKSSFDYEAAYNNAVNTTLIDLDEVGGGVNGIYPVPESRMLTLPSEISGDVRKMIDAGVFTHIQMPDGYFSNETDVEGFVGYQVDAIYNSFSLTPLTYSIVVKTEDKTHFFSEAYPQTVEIGAVGLGTELEGNGIVYELNFIFDYSWLTKPFNTCFLDESDTYLQHQVRFFDEAAPAITSISVSASEVCCGDQIPVVIQFSEPVYTDNISFEVDGQTLHPTEANGTISESVSFLYTVGDAFLGDTEVSVEVKNITGAIDLSGKEQACAESGSASAAMSAFDPERTLIYCAQPSVTIDQGINRCAAATVSIPLKRDGDLSNWLLDESRLDENGVSTTVKAMAITADGAVDIPLTVQTDTISVTELTGIFTTPENTTGEDGYYALELYMDTGSGYKLVYGLTTNYIVPPIILVNDTSDLTLDYSNWPAGNSIFADAGTDLSLGYTLNVAATWQEPDYFTWTSSNEEIADIDASGNIMLTGSAGTVYFTLTVTNPLSEESIGFESRVLTVHEADSAYLYVPNALKNQEILIGNSALISFSSNLSQRNAIYGGSENGTAFTFTLYQAEYEDDVLKKGGQLSTEIRGITPEAPMMAYTVPAELLQNTTVKGRYGYILEISAEDMQSGQLYTAEANIRVRALPAKAVLTRPSIVYLTDNADGFSVSFDVENKNAETEYLLTVTKNSQSDPVLTAGDPADIGRILTVEIGSVGSSRLLDVYTVSLKAKNMSDEAWSFDSYFIYVYNADAMKILVDSLSYGGMTLLMKANFEDEETIYDINALRYRSGLGLTRLVNINGSAYAWSAIADKVTWSVEGDSVSLWYGRRRIGSEYNPVLLPGTSLLLSGDGAGNSVVIATHTLTGMTATQNVSVAPIDKLYLFRTYPKVSCDMVYTNGRGVGKTVNAPFGEVGVYEESGIAGDVAFYPTGGAEEVYDFYVLNYSTLVANQNTNGRFDLHPINTIKLPAFNYNAALTLHDEKTGDAYTGDIIIRGGVYLNGFYQSETTINGKMGNADQMVSADDEGQYSLAFCPADFTNKLKASDTLKYVIEVSFADNSYKTQYITVENDAIQAGRESPLGVYLSAGIQKLDASSIQNSAVVLSQTFTLNGEEQPLSELLNLEEFPESAKLELELMIPDDYGRYYQLYLQDSTKGNAGYAGAAQVTASYPFSNTVTLHSSVDLRCWLCGEIKYTLKPGEKTNLYPVIRSTDGSTEIKLSKPIRIWNLYGIPKMENMRYGDTDYNKIYDLFLDASSMNLSFSDNDLVKDALDTLSDYRIDCSSLGLEVEATNDPLVYKGIIRFAVGSYRTENPSGIFVGSGKKTSYNFTPGVSDVKAMVKGTFLKKAEEEMKNSRGKKVYGGGAYFECEVYYSIEEQAWKIRLLSGDIYMGGGYTYYRNFNGWISFVPVTSTFQTSVTAELGLTVFNKRNKTVYIPRFRPVFSIYGFGGVGHDYEIVALKAGAYGYAEHEQLYLWYKDSNGDTDNGQMLKIYGEVGMEYEIKLFYVELHGKYVLTDIEKVWTFNNYDDIVNNIIKDLFPSFPFGALSVGRDRLYMPVLVPVEESISFEDRSYLAAYDRAWCAPSSGLRLMGAASSGSVTNNWENAYPYANPAISDDGALMTYLSDMDSKDIMDTAAIFTVKDGTDAYPEGTEIDAADYPDSDLSLSGRADSASAVWVRSFTNIDSEAGDEATVENAVEALAAAEVMAGIYREGAFVTTRLTNNDNPDLSPVTAAAGNRAVAAWRSVTLGALDNPLDFTSDYIMYSVYNGSAWSGAKCLYDGSVDSVSTLNAAMLPDGTSAIVYQITDADGGDSEIICAVLNADGEVIQTLRLTDNTAADENPQITTAEFPDGTRRFVLGWNAQTTSGESIVQLAAVNADGMLCPEFAQELSDSTGKSNYANFRFTKGADKLQDLSVVWCEPEDADNDGTYAGVVFGRKLVTAADGTVSLSGKLKLLELDEGHTVDSFDVRVDPASGKLYFSLLLTEPDGSATIATAEYEYRNALTVEAPDFEYEDVLPGLEMPVSFTVKNDGIEPITELHIVLGDQTYDYTEEAIDPGETKDFLVLYPAPDPLTDPSYTVTAQFGSVGGTDVQTGVLKLTLPDVGIYQIDLTKELQRERGFRVLLQNNAYGDLKAGKHTVRLEVSDSPEFDGTFSYTRTWSDDADLTILNDSLLALDVTLTEDDLTSFLDDDGEIPEGGEWVYFRVVLTEDGVVAEDSDISNDMDYMKIHSLIEQNGEAISLASLSQTSDGRTTVQVEAFNNSMNAITNGSLVVTLRDQNGRMLETKQTYNPTDSSSLLSIAGEEAAAASLLFDSAGYTADVTFARVSGESTRLSALNLTGVPLDFDPDIYAYTIQTYDLKETALTAVAENPASTISVKRNGVPVTVSGPTALSYGVNKFVIKVTTGDTAVPYTVTVQNNRTGGGTGSDGNDTGSNYSAGLTINGGKRIALNVRMSGGHAVLSLGSLAQEIFSGDTEAILTIPSVTGANGYTLEVPAETLSGTSTGAALTVSTELGSARIPSGMLAGMKELAGKTAGITIAEGDKASLPDDIRAAIGDHPLLSLTFTLDGLQTDWSNPSAPVTVRIPYTPSEAELENPESIVVWYIDGSGKPFCLSNGHYDPATGTVTFTTTHFSNYAVAYNQVSFSDVASEIWYHDAVAFIAARGITTGTGDGHFSPTMTLTRGQFVTLLLRAYGIAPCDASADNFSDAGSTYYTGYLAAAKRLGIANGVGDNRFAPERAVTRQEMFTLLYNALKAIGQLPAGDSGKTLSDFSDAGQIDSWAQAAMTLLVESGIVNGSGGKLMPLSTTTRAETAQVLYNLLGK